VTRAIVITGAPGAGKSSVLDALAGLLDNDAVPHAALESEQFAWGYPWLSEEEAYSVLGVACAALKELGRSLFLVAGTTETDAHIDGLTAAIAADETTVVCLTAAPETTAGRVLEREPPEWLGRDALVAHSRVLATQIPALRGIDLRVSTDGRNAREVALEIRSKTLERR
jgi:energy-coupling factor transporter ATP-binding protein EcfA2